MNTVQSSEPEESLPRAGFEPELVGSGESVESAENASIEGEVEVRFAEPDAKYLTARAVDLGRAWREGVRSVDEGEARTLTRCPNIIGGGLCFAYRGGGYYRVQLHDRAANGGTKTRAIPGVTPPPYVLSTTTMKEDSPLFIVEAPAKALALASQGFEDALALGGVNAGFFEKGTHTPQASVLRYVIPGRRINVVFDAGRANNPLVALAEARLARAALDVGAEVYLVELPLLPGGEDQGPDDFLAASGKDAFATLVAAAVPARPDAVAILARQRGEVALRALMDSMPFLAAIDVGGTPTLNAVHVELKAYWTKTDLKDRVKKFQAACAAKRASSSSVASGQSASNGGATGAVQAPASPAGCAPIVLVRGDEVELAEAHLQALGPEIVFTEGATYRYSTATGVWKVLSRAKQRTAIGGFAGTEIPGRGPLCLDDRHVRGALAHFEAMIEQEGFFDAAPKGIAFANGFLRLDATGVTLVPHAPDHRCRIAYPFDFNPATPCPEWGQYLETVWLGADDAEERMHALQEFVGAALFGVAPRFKTSLLLYGNADSGKSTCLDVVRGLFPAAVVCSISLHDFEQEYRRARLAGKLLNTVAEVPSSEMLRSEAFKAIIAGDQIEGRHIRGAPFDFVPTAAHLFAANTLPHVADRSEGVWVRWLVISFQRTFVRDRSKDGALARVGLAKRIVATEIPGVIAWAVAGLERLLGNDGRYTQPPSSVAALATWRRESNTVALFFDAELVLDPEATLPTGELYTGYRAWCTQNGFNRPLSHPSFGRDFHAVLRERTRAENVTRILHGRTIYVGVTWRDRPTVTNYGAFQ